MDAELLGRTSRSARDRPHAPLRQQRTVAQVNPTASPVNPPRSLQLLRLNDGGLVRLVRSSTEVAELASNPPAARARVRPLEVNRTTARSTGHGGILPGGMEKSAHARGKRRSEPQPSRPAGSCDQPAHMRDSGLLSPAGAAVAASIGLNAHLSQYSRDAIEHQRAVDRRAGFRQRPTSAAAGRDPAATTGDLIGVMALGGPSNSGPVAERAVWGIAETQGQQLKTHTASGAPDAPPSSRPHTPRGLLRDVAAAERERRASLLARKVAALGALQAAVDAREEARWAAMDAQVRAQAERTAQLQASGLKARRNRSGASYDLITLAPRGGNDAAALQAREAAAYSRAADRKAAISARSHGDGFDILTGLPRANGR